MPLEHKTLRSLECFDGIVAMSHYGRHLSTQYFGQERCGPLAKQIHYVPHGRDLDVFKPLRGAILGDESILRSEQSVMREKLKWPQEAFVVLIVAANTEGSNRKAFDAQLAAFCRWAQRRDARKCIGERDAPPRRGWESFLHIHSNAAGDMDLPRILEFHGECPNRHEFLDFNGDGGKSIVLFPEVGARGPRFSITPPSKYGKLSDPEMVEMYRAADVVMVGSCAEGFGVPIIES